LHDAEVGRVDLKLEHVDRFCLLVITTERLCIPTTKGRSTFISAVKKRKDEVYRKFVDEYTPVENAPFGNTKYHKSCYKTFTSKQNLFHGRNKS
jgi:hypothetical protein